MRVLVVSPTPFLPDIAGNRRLVRNRLVQLREASARVDFLYVPFEGPPDAAMRESNLVDEVHVGEVPPLPPSALEIADPDALAGAPTLPDALRGRRYALALVNYAFCTGWLSGVEADLTVLETHDRFANRHDVLAAAGGAPSWIALTVPAEARAAARVDVVGVVREDDRAYFAALGANAVAMLRPMEWRRLSGGGSRVGDSAPVRLGFVGSDNAVNAGALRELLRSVEARREELGRFEIHVFGRVCETLDADERAACVPHGVVCARDDLYDRFDILLNPTVSGTGLKIKTIEALAFGKPVISCADGAAGLPDAPAFMRLPSVAAMVDALAGLDADPAMLADLETRSAAAFDAYSAAAAADFEDLLARVRAGAPTRRADPPTIAWDGAPSGEKAVELARAAHLLRRGRAAMADVLARRLLAAHPLERAAYLVGACCAGLAGVPDRADALARVYLATLEAPDGGAAQAAIRERYGEDLRAALAAAPRCDADEAASRTRASLLAILAPATEPDAAIARARAHPDTPPAQTVRRIRPSDTTAASHESPRLVCAPGWSLRWAPVTVRPAVTLALVEHPSCRQVNAALAGLAVGDERYGFIFLKFIEADGWLMELHRADCAEHTFTTPPEAWDDSAWGPHVRIPLDATTRDTLDARFHGSDADLLVGCLAEVLDHAGDDPHANEPVVADLGGALAAALP